MTTSADDNDHETTAPLAAFMTPDGIFTDAAHLPPMLRRALVASLDAPNMDPEIRTLLAGALGVETQPGADTPAADRGAFIWDLLDAAFPTEPHLWRAGEAMLNASAVSSTAPDAATRRDAIDTAIAHLERHRALNEPQLSPQDALLARFRAQMGGL